MNQLMNADPIYNIKPHNSIFPIMNRYKILFLFILEMLCGLYEIMNVN